MKAKRILITGANGFIGMALCQACEEKQYPFRMALRCTDDRCLTNNNLLDKDVVFITDVGPDTDWSAALKSIDVVIHLAGRAHVLRETNDDPLTAYRRVNTLGVKQLVLAALENGVKRFLYISTIGVNGKRTIAEPFTENDSVSPHDDYATSKFEAEQFLHKISDETEMEIVIVRPPLVYGPKVKANFFRLLDLVRMGIPLPLNSVKNRRSFVYVDNLVDFLFTCVEHPAAVGEVFFVSDGEDLSTPELIRRIAFEIPKSVRLMCCPVGILRFGARLLGKKEEVEKLCCSLQVDISKARKLLGWQPPFTMNQGLEKTVDWYLRKDGGKG